MNVIEFTVAAVYALAATTFVVTGTEKVFSPIRLGELLKTAELAAVASPIAVRSLGALEIGIGVTALAFGPIVDALGAAAAIAVVVHLVSVTPVGLRLIERTGECGCSGRAGRLGGGLKDQRIALIVRNGALAVGVSAFGAGIGSDPGVAVASAAVGLVLGVQAVILARRALERLKPIVDLHPPVPLPK